MSDKLRPLLIVEDDPALQKQMRWAFDRYETLVASDRDSALAQVRRHMPPVVTMDLGLPPDPDSVSEGFALLQDLLGLAPDTKVIVLTGQQDRTNALRAIGMGAYDFFPKPFEPELLRLTIDRAFRLYDLQQENQRLQASRQPDAFAGLVTRDPEMLRICRTIEKVANTNATVLLLGESGTGKELLARALHDMSPRRSERFVAINCAAIPDTLLESELFGYEKGAFTGAAKQTLGKIETAHRGTLMLDEIGDLPMALQAKLLRFLQERVIERIGGREEIPVDVRIVCATHQDLKALIADGRFREDLYYRLAEIVVKIPPMRDRHGDAALLAHAFVQKFAAEQRRGSMSLRPDAVAAIEAHAWPGNVRELENCIKRAVIMADSNQIGAADVGLDLPGDEDLAALNLRQVRDDAERSAVIKVLGRVNGNIVKAADILGVSRPDALRPDASSRPEMTRIHLPRTAMDRSIFSIRPALVAGLLALLLVSCGGDKPAAMIASAKDYLAKDDPKAAVIQLRNALQKDEKNAEGRFLLGRALLETDDVLAAEKEFRKALELGYPADAVHPPLASVMLRKGEYKKVVDEYANSAGSTPQGTAELQTAVGKAQLALGQREAAQKAFAAAQAADPKYGPAIVGEAQMLAMAGDADGALKRTEVAIAATPKDPDAWQLKGDILAYQRQSEGAIAAYRKAIEVKATYLPAHAALVGALLRDGKQDDAAKALSAMKAAAPKHPQTHYMEAMVRLQEKNYTAARDAIQEYLRVLPENPAGLLLAATIDYQLRAYAQAEANLLKVLQQAPNQEYARRMLIGTYMERGQTAKALEALKPLLGRIDKDAAMLNVAGEVYLRNGEPAQAATYFQKASMVDPAGAQQKTGLALTHLAQGDTARGVEELEAAAASDPGVRPDLVLISASLQQRQYDKALTAIDALEKKQPDKPLASNLRGLALLGKNDVAGARKSFERAVAIDARFLPAVANLARLDLADKKPADAEKRFQDVIAKNPGNSQAILALAELRARNKGSPEEIVGLLNKAVAAAPTDVGPRLALINYYLRTKEPKKAVAAAQEAQAAIRDRPEIIEALGQAQQAAGDSNQALASFNRLGGGHAEFPGAVAAPGRRPGRNEGLRRRGAKPPEGTRPAAGFDQRAEGTDPPRPRYGQVRASVDDRPRSPEAASQGSRGIRSRRRHPRQQEGLEPGSDGV